MISSQKVANAQSVITVITTLILITTAIFAMAQAGSKNSEQPPVTSQQMEASPADNTEKPFTENRVEKSSNQKSRAPEPAQHNVTISADKITHQSDRGISQAQGNVEINYGDQTISGDKGVINHETSEGYMHGDMRYMDNEALITGDRVDFNTKDSTGVLYEARGDFKKEFFFTGEKIEKLSENQYLIKKGTCSTCPFPDQDWVIEADDVDLTIEGYAFFNNAYFKAGNRYIFYTPYFIMPLKTKRATGFLIPEPEFSSKYGFMLRNHFFWAIADNMDATFSHQYRNTGGNQFGLEYRYILSETTRGQLNAEYLAGSDSETEVEGDPWKLLYDHRQLMPLEFSNVIHIDKESKRSLARETFDDRLSRTRRYTDSFITLNRNWPTRNLYITLRERVSSQPNFDDELNELPKISFVNQSERLLDSPVYGSMEASFTSFKTRSTLPDDSIDTFDVTRLDLFPKLSAPWSVQPWLSITPELGFRHTIYTKGQEHGAGRKEINETFDRQYYIAALNLTGPKMYKIYERDDLKRPKLKHLLTPSLTWSFLPKYEDFDGDDRLNVRNIDPVVDRSDPRNELGFKISNQVLIKEVIDEEKSSTSQWMRFDILQRYDINEAEKAISAELGKRPFLPLQLDLDTRFYDWLLFNYNIFYDWYESEMESSSLEIGFKYDDRFHFALDRNFKRGVGARDDEVWDIAYFELNFAPKFTNTQRVDPKDKRGPRKDEYPFRYTIDYSIIYNEQIQEVDDSLLRLAFHPGCWGIAFSWYDRNLHFINSDGIPTVEHETKYLITFSIRGVGELFGKEKLPLAGRKIH